jgi:hypothetical protein
VATRLDEIHTSVHQVLKGLSEDDLQSKQINAGFRKLSELRDALAFELDRLQALAEAFDADNLPGSRSGRTSSPPRRSGWPP